MSGNFIQNKGVIEVSATCTTVLKANEKKLVGIILSVEFIIY